MESRRLTVESVHALGNAMLETYKDDDTWQLKKQLERFMNRWTHVCDRLVNLKIWWQQLLDQYISSFWHTLFLTFTLLILLCLFSNKVFPANNEPTIY